MTRTVYVGYDVDADGISVDPEKIQQINDRAVPTTVTNIRSFIGLANYYRKLVPNFASIVRPLTALTKKNRRFDWSPECQSAFMRIKEELTKDRVLAHFDPGLSTELRCDASDVGLGAILVQLHGENWRIVCCAGRCLSDTEKRYPTGERELLAIVYGLRRFRCYLFGIEFVVVTDHVNHRSLLTKADPSPRVARWLLFIMEFRFKIIYRPGHQHRDADEISRHPVFPAEEMEPAEALTLLAAEETLVKD